MAGYHAALGDAPGNGVRRRPPRGPACVRHVRDRAARGGPRARGPGGGAVRVARGGRTVGGGG